MPLSEDVVLVVDDDFLMREILTLQLESLGVAKILSAESALEALAVLASGEPVDVVLTDLVMPEMDGPRFIRELAELRCKARIILVSGARAELMQNVHELGMAQGLNIAGFLHKPIKKSDLQRLLEQSAAQPAKRPHAMPGWVRPPTEVYSPTQLAAALASKAIHPWYQPKVRADNLRVVGVEALARWRTADGQLVSPAVFVPAIEQHGLSSDLFFCMLEQVLAHLGQWREQGYVMRAAVNLSLQCTESLTLPNEIEQRLAKAGISADQLIIEITESKLMTERTKSIETITRLALMGLHLSIDDVGTGCSSLQQLAELPFNELKIDARFVQHAATDLKARSTLQSTIVFGRSLGMDVMAEGVEHFSQLDMLRHFGADCVQGYLIAKPAAAPDFLTWMTQWRPGLVTRPGCDRPPCLLLVDDHTPTHALVAQALHTRMPGAQIIFAADGEEALALATRQAIDFTVLDSCLPGPDGLELLQRMQELLPAARHTLLTTHLNDDVAAKAVRLGALYCPKPLTGAQANRTVAFFNAA